MLMTRVVRNHAAAALRDTHPRGLTSHSCLRDASGFDDVIPSVQSWSMALMMRSHSSARVRQPHSPSSGTYSSSFCSSSTSGTLMPNSSGNVAAQGERKEWKNITSARKRRLNVCALSSRCTQMTYHHQGWAPYPKDSSSPCLHCPNWMTKSIDMNHQRHQIMCL